MPLATQHVMQANRGRNTGPELAVRRLLHARGRRYRVHYPVPGNARRTIDIAFPRARIACFVDGCFWHGCPAHFIDPKTNIEFWGRKLAGNAARDVDTNRLLEGAGWQVLRFWEHDSPELIATEIERILLRLELRR